MTTLAESLEADRHGAVRVGDKFTSIAQTLGRDKQLEMVWAFETPKPSRDMFLQ